MANRARLRFRSGSTARARAEHAKLLVNLLSEDHSEADDDGSITRLIIEGYGYRWYRVGGLDYLLRRIDIDDPVRPEAALNR